MPAATRFLLFCPAFCGLWFERVKKVLPVSFGPRMSSNLWSLSKRQVKVSLAGAARANWPWQTPNWPKSLDPTLTSIFRGSGQAFKPQAFRGRPVSSLSIRHIVGIRRSPPSFLFLFTTPSPRPQPSVMASPVTPVWFMVVDHNFTCILKGANCVDVPSDGLVYHFLKEIKALGWDILDDSSGDLNVWKLRTPLPSEEVKREYLAKLKRQTEEEEREKGKPNPKPKGKAKAKEEEWGVALLLEPTDKISLLFEELSLLEPETSIHVLVQVPVTAGGTSCCAVSTRCQLIQLWTSSKTHQEFGKVLLRPRELMSPVLSGYERHKSVTTLFWAHYASRLPQQKTGHLLHHDAPTEHQPPHQARAPTEPSRSSAVS